MTDCKDIRMVGGMGVVTAAVAAVLSTDLPRWATAASIGLFVGVVGTAAVLAWARSQNARFIRWLSGSLFLIGASCAGWSALTITVRMFTTDEGHHGVRGFGLLFASGTSNFSPVAMAIVAWSLSTYLAWRLPID